MFDSEYVKEIVRDACRKFSGDAYVKVVFKTLGDGLSSDANKKIYFTAMTLLMKSRKFRK